MDSTAVLLRPEAESAYKIIVTSSYATSTRLALQAVTDRHPWERRLEAGVEELRWFQENREQLVEHEDRWVAILGQEIVASGRSMGEVRDELVGQNVRDALVLHVPANVSRREYFIG